jgi:hypothetical protein
LRTKVKDYVQILTFFDHFEVTLFLIFIMLLKICCVKEKPLIDEGKISLRLQPDARTRTRNYNPQKKLANRLFPKIVCQNGFSFFSEQFCYTFLEL